MWSDLSEIKNVKKDRKQQSQFDFDFSKPKLKISLISKEIGFEKYPRIFVPYMVHLLTISPPLTTIFPCANSLDPDETPSSKLFGTQTYFDQF